MQMVLNEDAARRQATSLAWWKKCMPSTERCAILAHASLDPSVFIFPAWRCLLMKQHIKEFEIFYVTSYIIPWKNVQAERMTSCKWGLGQGDVTSQLHQYMCETFLWNFFAFYWGGGGRGSESRKKQKLHDANTKFMFVLGNCWWILLGPKDKQTYN